MERRLVTATWLLVPIASVLVLACTSAHGNASSGGQPAAREACFNVSTVDSFSPLDSRSVYLRAVGGEQYLLTLDSVYPGLPFATGITMAGAFNRVCSNTGAAVTFTEFGRQVFCRIVRVEAVTGKEAAQKLVEGRGPSKPKD